MSKYIIIMLILWTTNCLSQTCVIIHKTKNEIIIGADSRQNRFPLNRLTGKIDTVSSSMCKIFTTPTFSFAVSGLCPQSFIDSAFKSISKGGNLNEITIRFRNSINKEVVETMDQELKNYKQYQIAHPLYSGISGFFIFGFENDSSKINYLLFRQGNKQIESAFFIIDTCEAMGHTKEIREQGLLKSASTWSNGAVKGIENLIKIEINSHPKMVAEPIDILKVTRKSKKWIAKKQECS